MLLVLVLLGFWLSRGADQPPRQAEPPAPAAIDTSPAPAAGETASPETQPATREAPPAEVPNVTIRDLDGKTVFRGTVDVQPTLDRIAAGKRLDYRNDGSTFQNREGRLPRKSSGYYKEYVHPTPSLSGPGPQRIVGGEKGEAYYTPDHYRTFQRIR